MQNNGNPEGNFIKIHINQEDKKPINLTNIGEVPLNDDGTNSVLAIKNLLIEKEPKKKEYKINEENVDYKKELGLSFDINKHLNDNTNSLPWRSGSYFRESKKNYYNNTYRNNKKDSYFYNNGKNYNKNRYSLNQPQSKKSNKFD